MGEKCLTAIFLHRCVQANAAKYGKAPEVIDFAAYKNKLRFTGSAVASLTAAEMTGEAGAGVYRALLD